MTIVADFAQTFLVDSNAVLKSPYVFLSKIDLYFKNKPSAASSSQTSTGGVSVQPGATVYICETENINNIATPKLNTYIKYGRARVEYANINTSTTGQSATTFRFDIPVPISTDKFYAFVIKLDSGDSQFALWRNKAGETYNETQSSPVTKGALDGQFFVLTNGTSLTPLTDTDLKFNISSAVFQQTPTLYNAVNRDMEYVTFFKDFSTGRLIGGESVFCNTGYVTAQTVAIVAGNNIVRGVSTVFTTNFTAGDTIVLNSGNTNIIRRINSISNNTTLSLSSPVPVTNSSANYLIAPTARVVDFNKQKGFTILGGSSANSTYNFAANSTSNTIVGELSGSSVKISSVENYPVNQFLSEFKILAPVDTTTNTYVNFSNSTYVTVDSDIEVRQFKKTNVVEYKAYCSSRSNEVSNPAFLNNDKSVNFYLLFDTDNPFLTPVLDEEDMLFHATSVYADANYTDEELPGKGRSAAKYIGRDVSLAKGVVAEDIKVYLTAHRPAGTELQVYVSFYNDNDGDIKDNKLWTRLKNVTPDNLFSAVDNENDLVELEYDLSYYPLSSYDNTISGRAVTGTFTINFDGKDSYAARTLLGTSGFINDVVSPGNLVRIYNPLFPDQSVISEVEGVYENRIRITRDINYYVNGDSEQDAINLKLASFASGGLVVEVLDYPGTAFKDYLNSGKLTYHSSELSVVEGYTAFKIKIILVSDSTTGYYPSVSDVRAIALSV
jgi:hypothetical protein